MSASYTDPGARTLAQRLAALSAGKLPDPSDPHVPVPESPEERWSRLGQLALNVAPMVLPVLGRLIPRRNQAPRTATEPAPKARRRRLFSRWRMVRLGALALGLVYLFRSRLLLLLRRPFARRVS